MLRSSAACSPGAPLIILDRWDHHITGGSVAHRCCRRGILFLKIQVRLRSWWSYLWWGPCCMYSARNRWKSLPQLRTSIRTLHYVHPSIHLVNQDMYMWPWKVMTNLVTQCFNRKKTDELRQKRLYLLINATSCSNNYLVISISLGSSFKFMIQSTSRWKI